jgi:tripartite-type tricarboxylate transporter receptor subunit TctC
MRHLAYILSVAIALATAVFPAQAAYPERQVRIILPYAAGGGADVLTRVVASALSDLWKQPVITDNRPGAGATIGTDLVAKAVPDGHTLLMTASTIAVSPVAYPNLPYDVLRDFAPITLVAESPYVLAVNSGLDVQAVSDLLQLARNQPGKLNFGSPGRGTLSHLTFELLSHRTGAKATVIPYKGSNPALIAALAGEVDFVLDTPAAVMQHVNSGKLRALAVSSAARSASVPSIPSMAEAGVPDVDVVVWFGLLAPAGTSTSILDQVHRDVARVLASPEVVQKLAQNGLEVATSRPQEFAEYLKSEVGKWSEVVTSAKIKFD